MTEKIADRIARLEQELKAARAAQKKRAAELAERQKWLIGSVVQSRIESGRIPISSADLLAMLAEDLTRAHDRAAFDLPPLQQAPTSPAPEQPPENQPAYEPPLY